MTNLEKLKAEIDDLYKQAEQADYAVVMAEREHRHLLKLAHYACLTYNIELDKAIELEKAGK
jgi:hypothetical protein